MSRFFIDDGFYDGFTDTLVGNDAMGLGSITTKLFQNEMGLKEVLSVADYNKTEPIIEYLDKHMKIPPNMAEKLIEKSVSTAWRYLKVLVDARVIMPEGGTNNLMYVLCPEYHG